MLYKSLKDTKLKITPTCFWRLAGSGSTKTVSFTKPHKKKSHGVKSGDRGATALTRRHLFVLYVVQNTK